MTLAPGIFDMTPEQYHQDPCDKPSLSSSGVKRLLSGSPAEFAAAHSSRLAEYVFGPNGINYHEALTKSSDAMDDGTIAHAKILQTALDFWAMDPQDCPERTEKGEPYKVWGGKAAKWKEKREAEGVIFTSRAKLADIQSAVDSMDRLIRKTYGADWLSLGKAEQTFIWQRQTAHGLIWCRAMLDYHSLQQVLILDPKFTNLGISDRDIQKKVADERLDIQQVFYEEAVVAHAPKLRDRVVFRFPIAQLNPPFQSRWIDLDANGPDWLPEARKDTAEAADKFAECLYSNSWPPYAESCSPRRPQWMVAQSENRDLAEMESKLEMR